MNKNILFWNVDTQKDFVNANGKLPVPDAETIKPILFKLTKLAQENDIQVVSTCDWHDDKTEEISENPDYIDTFPEHCMSYTSGALFVSETTPDNPYVIDSLSDEELNINNILKYRNIIIRKDKFDVFEGNKHTNEILDNLSQEIVVVYGVAENVCVDFAVKGLIERGKSVYVISNAIKGLPNIESPISIWEGSGVKLIEFNQIEDVLGNFKQANILGKVDLVDSKGVIIKRDIDQ